MRSVPLVVALSEWEERLVPDLVLEAGDIALLAREEGDARVEIEELRAGLRIRATSWVGVVRLSRIEIRILPKLAGGEAWLLAMLDLVTGIDALRRLEGVQQIDASGQHLLDLFALLLCEASEQVVRAGLIADYVEREEELGVVRGRLLVERQVLQRFGRVDRLICRHDERETDIAENQLLAEALRRASRHARAPSLRHRAHRLAETFLEVCDPGGLDLIDARRLVYHRMNEHYRSAHGLAWLVLDGLGVRDLHDGGVTDCFAFLLDMNRLFEDFVAVLIGRLLAGTGAAVHQQRRDGSVLWNMTLGRSFARVIPDLLVAWPGTRSRLPVDAKYKLYDDKKADRGDIYQAFLYAFAYHGDPGSRDSARALLMYPSTLDLVTHQRIQVRNTEARGTGEIGVVGIPIRPTLRELDGSPGPCCKALAELLEVPKC